MGLSSTISDERVLQNYRNNYGLGDEVGLSEVGRHVALERELTDYILGSNTVNRWERFSTAYSRLYAELPWLSGTGSRSKVDLWAKLLRPNSRVLEIGSGAGTLITGLASRGFECVATEMSRERGGNLATGGNIAWHQTDGVNLDKFEAPSSFDHVISDQVVEHLHPDDISEHFATARVLLKPSGSYILRTPHRSVGPSDLSLVLNLPTPEFMHLHEFDYREFEAIRKSGGYTSVRAVVYVPRVPVAKSSRLFFALMVLVDRIEARVAKTRRGRRVYRLLARSLLATPNIWVELRR